MAHKIFFLLAFLTAQFAIAQTQLQVADTKMSVAGTSTMHDWKSEVTNVQGTASIVWNGQELKSIDKVAIKIAAKSIKSEKGNMMDKLAWKALKADEFPTITYTLQKVNSITKSGAGYAINATGKLTIAGTSKVVTMNVTGKVLPNGGIQFSGTHKLLMTDYNIEPPTAMLGTMKTGNEVTIAFETTLALDTKALTTK